MLLINNSTPQTEFVVSMPCSSVPRASPGKYPTRAHIQKSLARGLLQKIEIWTCSCSILYPWIQLIYSLFLNVALS